MVSRLSTAPTSAAPLRPRRSPSPGASIPVHQDARLRECNYGELNGRPADDVTAVKLTHVDEPFPGGESYRDVVERTRAFLAELVERHDGERVLVIAHSANRWALEYLLGGVPLEQQVDAAVQLAARVGVRRPGVVRRPAARP